MELPPELTRIPLSALDVLRYMGSAGVTQGDADSLASGTGMSERGMGKAIRGLVTKGYLTMDSSYIYHLTNKGEKAIGDIAAYDVANPRGAQSGASDGIEQELVAVAPSSIPNQQGATLQLGINGAASADSQIILRLTTVGGDVNPREVTLNLAVGQGLSPTNIQVTPNGQHSAVRVRVEAVQIVDDTDVYPAGGMFFDVPVGQASGQLQAWVGTLSLQG